MQWELGQYSSGLDLNVMPVWSNNITGAGVVIREPHGNLISRSKGEEEENSGGKKRAASGGVTLFYSSFFLQRSTGARALTYPTNALLSLEHACV
ncbi:hypothetical protein F7725_018892, partial [Dissostichus mawsoni]